MSLQDPTKKMSKSAEDPNGSIFLLDSESVIKKKINRAVTDSDGRVWFDEEKKPGISNLITIYATLTGTSLESAIERFDGLVILTSNHVVGNNMDSAFARRIRHHVAFTAPDDALRVEIWKKHFPASAPLDKTIDFKSLAEDYEFSGGIIKQIALKAAFKAVREGSLITEDIIRELCKFECGNNLVGYRKKTATMGFGK